MTKIRALLALGFLLGAGLALVSVVNHFRIQGATLQRQLGAVIARSEYIRDHARPGYQDEILASLPANPLNGPFFRLDERLAEAVAIREPARPEGGEATEILFSYEFEAGGGGGLEAARERSSTKLEDGVLVVAHDAADYLTNTRALDVPKDELGDIVIRARVRRGRNLRLSWSADPALDDAWEGPGKPKLDVPLIADGEFHTYIINAKAALTFGMRIGDHLQRIYVRPSDAPRDKVEIEFIRFVSKRSKYRLRPRGPSYETLGGELRRVLYMLPDQEIRYRLRVPEDAPRIDFGAGLLVPGRPVRFRLALRDAAGVTPLYDETLADTSRWRDSRIDLSLWAGQDVELTLAVDGAPENVAFWSSPIVSSRPKKRFNMILVLEDTLRSDHLSTYGYARPTAPFKDRLMAERGIVFLNAVSQATMTRPSVASMMTSLLPTATGVWKFTDMLSDNYLTLAEVLRSQGFVTASFIQNPNAGPVAGLHQGFDVLFDPETTAPGAFVGNAPGAFVDKQGEVFPKPEELFSAGLMRWIEAHPDRNFFLYLHTTDPHGPYEPPEEYRSWYQDPGGHTPVPPYDRVDAPWVEAPTLEGRRALYDGEIRRNDSVLEGFVGDLERRGFQRDSLLVFLSDHGEHLGEHGIWEHHPPGYRQVTGVQFMFVPPERFETGRRISETVGLIDLMPTLLELAGVDANGLLMQGDSLVGLLDGDGGSTAWRDRVVLSEEPMSMDKANPSRQQGLRVIGSFFYRDWHFIASRQFWPRRWVPESLRLKVFHLSKELDEEPLWSFAPDVLMRLRFAHLLDSVQKNDYAARRSWTSEEQDATHRMDPEALEQLKALGYVD